MIYSVRMENICKRFGPGQFSLNAGKVEFKNKHVQVIVGPNGSGKTTLLNLLAFLEDPDEGRISLNNKPVFPRSNSTDLHKRIGFLRQSPYLFNMDVFENVALGLRIRKLMAGKITSRVNNMMAILKMEHLKKRKIKNLSRGEYQKAAIARVLVLEPEIILMDEPAANIDEQNTLLIEEAVEDVRRRTGTLVIMTTHSLSQAYRISPEIFSMRDGKIAGSIRENVGSEFGLGSFVNLKINSVEVV